MSAFPSAASVPASSPVESGVLRSRGVRRTVDGLVGVVLAGCGIFSILTTFAIIAVLLEESRRFFASPEVSASEFFFSGRWSPLLGAEKHFGIWPLICGTGLVAGVSACLALPLGLVTAIYLSEYAPRPLRAFLKPVLELLAGIPTVVYGFFALTVITPALKAAHEITLKPLAATLDTLPSWLAPDGLVAFIGRGIDSYNALSAGLAVGIMTLPIVCSLSEDALQAVPRSLREGAFACGATKFDVSAKVVVPAALSGIIASYLLAIARAIGETMIVALAAGGLAQLTADPRNQVQTMTGYIVQVFTGDTTAHGIEYKSSYAVAGMLFLLTFIVTLIGYQIMRRYREAYE
ncbi:MAG: phosphate ABC transporter permease subunit PstC [Planctomycetota bacterium]|nr:phosphate ABC transporter permease subunit PstC [Planctomycetota bacterium]